MKCDPYEIKVSVLRSVRTQTLEGGGNDEEHGIGENGSNSSGGVSATPQPGSLNSTEVDKILEGAHDKK